MSRLERLVALARRAGAKPRRRARPQAGRGIEPGALRDYTPGDDVRLIDWAALARLERWLVKVPEEQPESRLDLLVDGSASMGHGEPSPHVRACLTAASLAACALARDVVTTVWWAGEPLGRTELRRPGELIRALRFFARQQPTGGGGLARCAQAVGDRRGAGGRAVVVSDGLDPVDVGEAARRLRRQGSQALVALVEPSVEFSPAAAEAAAEAGWVDMIDAETGERRRVPFAAASQAAALHVRRQQARQLGAALEGTGVEILTLSGESPFEQLALELLRGDATLT
ncbi:DUF58 domain-containing protein [Planctomycetota bacterium]|nr:DUF58 domain-containing protein [Planctomycetota bacterium]